MTTNDTFYISEEILENHIELCINCGKRFVKRKAAPYRHYESGPNSIRSILNLFKTLCVDDIIVLLKDCLGIMTTDSTDRLYFSHQYIRDYFAAMYCVREMYHLNISHESNPQIEFGNKSGFGQHIWSAALSELIYEILSVPSEYQLGNLTYKTINLYRNKLMSQSENDFSLANLIHILALENDGNLYGYNFSGLNLNNCRLNNYNFSSFDKKYNTQFHHSHIGVNTFSSSVHKSTVLKWCISEDEKTIVSISEDMEIKLWDLYTHNCLYTRQLNIDSNDTNIYSLECHKNSTLVVISFGDSRGTITTTATYDFRTEKYTCYEYCTDTTYYIVYFGYDIYQNTLLTILSNGSVLRHNVNVKYPLEKLSDIQTDFLHRITTDYLPRDFKVSNELKKIYLLPHNKLFYAESDVFYPYFHGIDDCIYYGSDSYNATIVDGPIEITNLKLNSKHSVFHINYFIYDLITHELHNLQLDCSPNEITSLAITGRFEHDSITTHTAISKDRNRIAIHNLDHIFIYDIQNNDYVFRTTHKLPCSSDFYIKFCHQDSDILTLYDNEIIHLNLETGLPIYRTRITGIYFDHMITPSSNHVVSEIAFHYTYGGNLNITNIYNQVRNTLILSQIEEITDIYCNNENIYVLFNNCTIVYLKSISLKVINCYNFAPGRKVLAHTYDQETNRLFFVSGPTITTTDEPMNKITSIDLNTGETFTSLALFSDVNKIHCTNHSNYLLLLCDGQINLLDMSTLKTLDVQKTMYHLYEPDLIWNDGNRIHTVFTYDLIIHHKMYYGLDIIYSITDNNKLKIDEIVYLPSFVVDSKTPELMYRYIPYTGIAFVKSILQRNNITIPSRYLKYSTPDEYEYRMLYDCDIIARPLSEWNLVCLHTKDGIIKTPRQNDFEILPSWNSITDMSLGRRNNHYCSFTPDTDDFKHLSKEPIYANSNRILQDTNFPDIIYYQDINNCRIVAYDLIKQEIINESPELYPNFLAYNCDFSTCTGDLSRIPSYS